MRTPHEIIYFIPPEGVCLLRPSLPFPLLPAHDGLTRPSAHCCLAPGPRWRSETSECEEKVIIPRDRRGGWREESDRRLHPGIISLSFRWAVVFGISMLSGHGREARTKAQIAGGSRACHLPLATAYLRECEDWVLWARPQGGS